MTDERPKWPESLPPPIEVIEGPRQAYFSVDNLQSDTAIDNLVHDLYWFPDDERFLYFRHGEGIGAPLTARLEERGIEMRKTEMYFYRHPKPAYDNAFVRVLPHSEVPEWKRKAAEGDMYGRVTLTLESWRRKEIDVAVAAQATRQTIAEHEPLLEAKPGLWGFHVNLNRLLSVGRKWWRKKRSS